MFVRRNIPWSWTLYYSWPSLLYFLSVAVAVFCFQKPLKELGLVIPFEFITVLGTALSIFLGFKNSEAYARWWEARKIWGLAVNYSRAWSRQVLTLMTSSEEDQSALAELQQKMIFRHLAFIHALRIFLRSTKSYPQEVTNTEPVSARNDYQDCQRYLPENEFDAVVLADNPPEAALQLQGRSLQQARERGWITDYVLVHLDQTLVEFNNVQGMAERIKKTPLPRLYSYFQRLFVHILGTLLPFALLVKTGWMMVPLAVTLSFVFLSLDLIGSRTEDPFENRVDDTPMSSLTRTIERNLRESLGEKNLPPQMEPKHGVLF